MDLFLGSIYIHQLEGELFKMGSMSVILIFSEAGPALYNY